MACTPSQSPHLAVMPITFAIRTEARMECNNWVVPDRMHHRLPVTCRSPGRILPKRNRVGGRGAPTPFARTTVVLVAVSSDARRSALSLSQLVSSPVGLSKRLALRALASQPLSGLLARANARRGTIFMLHRFASPTGDPNGHDPRLLRYTLQSFRNAGVQLVALDELVRDAVSGEVARGSRHSKVAFTIDDGYQDFAEVAAPIFREFDCHATVFVVPGVIDGQTWFWWDQIEYIVLEHARQHARREERATSSALRVEIGGDTVSLTTDTFEMVCERLKTVSDVERRAVIASLSDSAAVPIPSTVPAKYAVMSWDTLRSLESESVAFGAHTLTHPILSRCTAEQSQFEIVESLRRIRQELRAPSDVFCYPNGQPDDFGARETFVLESQSLVGAVATHVGHLTPALSASASREWRWAIPRFAYQDLAGSPARDALI